jgi:DNA repair protein RadC
MECKANHSALYHVAEVELTYRSKVKASERPQINSSGDAYSLLKQVWEKGKIDFVEQFKVLLLNRANKVIGLVNVSTGGVTGTVVDPKIVYVAAIKANACAIIISHNHPSGQLRPSRSDEELTRKIKSAGSFLDIKLVDHLIISEEAYFSFADEGLL